MIETLTLFNGNDQKYEQYLPKIVYLTAYINDIALNHIKRNTGLTFIKTFFGYEVQPTKSEQITKLFLTYNFKTEYHNNATHRNTLFLKSMVSSLQELVRRGHIKTKEKSKILDTVQDSKGWKGNGV